ncbi:MAG: hypothetical protein NVS4B3_06490 [Gemmatimonadaceae bacterium]
MTRARLSGRDQPRDPTPLIRPVASTDRDWILALVPRLHEFGPPGWRDAHQMTAAATAVIAEKLGRMPPSSAILVAETAGGVPLGFVHLESASDYFTGEQHGHISDIIVDRAHEGSGAGRALMRAAEGWAGDRGYRLLTLNVFGANARARALYEHLGYAPETTRYVKALR